MEPAQIFVGKVVSPLWSSQADARDTYWYHFHTEPALIAEFRLAGSCPYLWYLLISLVNLLCAATPH